jgi:hypothetical protein
MRKERSKSKTKQRKTRSRSAQETVHLKGTGQIRRQKEVSAAAAETFKHSSKVTFTFVLNGSSQWHSTLETIRRDCENVCKRFVQSQIMTCAQDESDAVFISNEGLETVGFALIGLNPRSKTAIINYVCVRRGSGMLFMQNLLETLKSEKYQTVELEAIDSAVERFYLKLGFILDIVPNHPNWRHMVYKFNVDDDNVKASAKIQQNQQVSSSSSDSDDEE